LIGSGQVIMIYSSWSS